MPETILPPGSLVYCYARDSGGPSQDVSLSRQRESIERYAAAAGLVIVRWFTETHTARNDDRPAFQEMINLCRRKPPPVAGVIVWHSSRFSRNEDDAPMYRALLRRNGVQPISVTDKAPDGPMARVIEAVMDFSNADLSRTLAVNVKAGQERVLRMGYMCGAKPPLGYLAERTQIGTYRSGQPRYGCRWLIDPVTAPTVVRAFELRAQGEPIKAIARMLNLHATRQGVQAMLHNPAYRGIYRYGGVEYTGIVPALVSDGVWQAAQRREPMHPRTVASGHLLTGLLRCGYCGYAMTAVRNHTVKPSGLEFSYRYYHCVQVNTRSVGTCPARMVRADKIESDVVETVFASLPGELAALVAAAKAIMAADAQPDHRVQLEREIADTERAISALLDLAERGTISGAEISRRLRERESTLCELRQQLAAVPERPPILDATPAEVAAFVADLRARYEAGDIHVKRHVLRQVISGITFGPDLVIAYRLPGWSCV